MTSIEINDVSKWYPSPDGEPLHVLNEIDLTIEDESFACLLGPSGCGKSTLLNIIAELDSASRGGITFGGQDQEEVSIGYVFQDTRLLDWKTVADNVRFALKTKGIPEAEHEERITKYLQMVGLEEFRDNYPLTLSGGMQSRVGIARAFAIEPDVLLMDEPFSNLDELTARELRNDLLDMWTTEAQTVLFITHNALEAAFLGDVVHVMSDQPTNIVTSRPINIDRPREYGDPALFDIQEELVEGITSPTEDPEEGVLQ